MGEETKLPFDLSGHNRKAETIGTTVYLPDAQGSDPNKDYVVKIGKDSQPYFTNPIELLRQVMAERRKERAAVRVASEQTAAAMEPQHYVLVEGSEPGQTRVARVQKYQEGTPLIKLGFSQIMDLEPEKLKQLRSLVKDSIISYIKTGRNFDLFGSDERDAYKKSKMLNIKRCIFPLRNSNNIFSTQDGIKFIDPSVLSDPEAKQRMQSRAIQFLFFLSSVFDYLLLSARVATKSK